MAPLSDAARLARIAQLTEAMEDAKAEAKLQAEEAERLQLLIMGLMDKKTYDIDLPGGGRLKVTRVQGGHVVTDPTKLRKALRADQWKLVTDTVLSKSKLEAAMTTGQVDPSIVAACSDDIPNKPYVKVTRTNGRRKRTP